MKNGAADKSRSTLCASKLAAHTNWAGRLGTLALTCTLSACASAKPDARVDEHSATHEGTVASNARGSIAATATAERTTEPPWWSHAVFYEVYPRSFQDSNGDGIGDLAGITSRLDYLVELGVDAIWVTPFYPSPQVDFGYDVSNYVDVDPQFGTLADFDVLLREAHARGIRVVTDLVLNHTSDQHPWFLDSRASTSATKRDWYIWRPDHEGKPPNNWASIFEPSAWTRDARTGMHYYHAFYEAQPDLNLRNPEVERELLDVVRFWLARGVDGFRLDAIAHLYEDESFRDNPWSETLRPGGHGEHEQIHAHTMFQPECHDFLRKVREVADTFPGERVLISEAYTDDAAGLLPYYGAKGEEIQLPFNFQLMRATKLDAAELRGLVGEVEKSLDGRPTTWVLGNHDRPRPIDRFAPTHAPAATRTRIAKTLATLLLTLRGSPFLYYGDELGMVTTDPKRLADVQDPVGKRYWPANKGRDGERTPMQWDASPEAGFTTGTPWLPVPKGARTTNVAVERNDSASIWNFYRELIALRRRHPALTHGALHLLETDDAVFAYERATSDERIVVAINTAATTRTLVLQGSANVLLSNARERDATLEQSVSLAPNEAVLLMLRD